MSSNYYKKYIKYKHKYLILRKNQIGAGEENNNYIKYNKKLIKVYLIYQLITKEIL